MVDCARWFNRDIIILHSNKYVDTWAVWTARKYLAGINGAPCTTELKVGPRLEYQQPTDIHVFGYTYDNADRQRADRLRENYPELTILTPLIDRQLTKQACLALIQSAGTELPAMYKLGFHNNNCIPCPKATSPAYWALVRKTHPQAFERMAKLSRELGVRLCRIKNVRSFIDEIPLDQSTKDPIQPACDFLCHLIEQEFGNAA